MIKCSICEFYWVLGKNAINVIKLNIKRKGEKMRGISFNLKNDYNKILSIIFKDVDLAKYNWNISEDEVYLHNSDIPLFNKDFFNGNEFYNLISDQEYLVIAANIRAGFHKETIPEMNDYNEFYHSQCQINLFCTDVFYYEIYAKDKKVLETIKSNCINNAFEKIEDITEENDGRYRFTIT